MKVQVAAAPEKGKANEAVIEVVAQWLGVKSAAVQIASGHTQPRKVVRVRGVTVAGLAEKMQLLK